MILQRLLTECDQIRHWFLLLPIRCIWLYFVSNNKICYNMLLLLTKYDYMGPIGWSENHWPNTFNQKLRFFQLLKVNFPSIFFSSQLFGKQWINQYFWIKDEYGIKSVCKSEFWHEYFCSHLFSLINRKCTVIVSTSNSSITAWILVLN